jgi:hypothetical protein
VKQQLKNGDEYISKLTFRRFEKKYDEALEASYTACSHDIKEGTLHEDLPLFYPSTGLMPKEKGYIDEAMKHSIKKHDNDP